MTVPAGPDFSGAIQGAADEGLAVITDNVLVLFTLPAAWVAYKVARKVLGKIG